MEEKSTGSYLGLVTAGPSRAKDPPLHGNGLAPPDPGAEATLPGKRQRNDTTRAEKQGTTQARTRRRHEITRAKE